jgi:hypothetical protein
MLSNNERRQNQRLNGSTIQGEVKRKSLFRLGGYKQLKIVDFNRFGARILHSERYRIGEELLFNINRQSINVREVIGFVCHVEEQEDNYSYGIQFDFSANKHMRSAELEESLSQIEEALEAGLLASTNKPQTGTKSPHSETP